jgi:signal transduction histidine kinase/CheY-like chemotaxis protein
MSGQDDADRGIADWVSRKPFNRANGWPRDHLTVAAANDDFLAGGGVAGACVRAVDWSATPLGPIDTWPATLRTMLGVILHSRHPMFLWWGPELIQFYNDGYLPSFGAGKHPTAMGQRGRDCWLEIWPIIGPQIEGVMSHGRATWNEDQLVPIFRNGRLEDVYWTYGYSPVFDGGRVAGTLVVCTETTARVNAERRLRTARVLSERASSPHARGPIELFDGMTTDVPYALVFSADGGGRQLTASTGLSGAELAIALPFFDAKARAWRVDDLAGPTAADPIIAAPALSRDDLTPHAFFAALRTPAQPDVTGFVAFGISSKLPFDDRYRTHLQQLADVLSVAQAQTLLRDNQDRIQRQLATADRLVAVGTLAAGTAHEINNPLTFVTANLGMILDELQVLGSGASSSGLGEIEAMVRSAIVGAERVRTIVQGLQTFSHSGDERTTMLELAPVLGLAINLAIAEIRPRARLVTDYGTTPLIEGDPARLKQLFINLLINAAHAIPEGDIDANEIRVTTSTDAVGRAVIEIRDSGRGIPADILDRIFDPFVTTKEIGAGVGLGLSISRNIVAAMGGEITVSTERGRGTTFWIVLPPARRAPQVEVVPPSAAQRGAVLVVDDEPVIGQILARALRNHDVTVVATVDAALDALAAGKPFDVIFSDLMMPGATGMDFYAEVRRRFPALAARIVFVTGGAFTPTTQTFLDRVPNERLNKPFDTAVVRSVVARFMNADRAMSSSDATG